MLGYTHLYTKFHKITQYEERRPGETPTTQCLGTYNRKMHIPVISDLGVLSTQHALNCEINTWDAL